MRKIEVDEQLLIDAAEALQAEGHGGYDGCERCEVVARLKVLLGHPPHEESGDDITGIQVVKARPA